MVFIENGIIVIILTRPEHFEREGSIYSVVRNSGALDNYLDTLHTVCRSYSGIQYVAGGRGTCVGGWI